jgi:hypothetical protein
MKSHTPGPWKIVPCPVHHGKHPFHDHRWIMTDDSEVVMSEHVPNDWHLSNGSAICMMRDVDPRNAHLIASAPELLAALEAVTKAYVELVQSDYPPSWSAEKDSEVIAARAAIAKAKGNA